MEPGRRIRPEKKKKDKTAGRETQISGPFVLMRNLNSCHGVFKKKDFMFSLNIKIYQILLSEK